MADGCAMNAQNTPNRKKLFDLIGLGTIDDIHFVAERMDGGIDYFGATEKEAAIPREGKLWIVGSVKYGHFNGPKRRFAIMTDGEEVLTLEVSLSPNRHGQSSTIFNALRNKTKHMADKSLKKFVLKGIGDMLF
jgi:hypothetical protein